MGCCELPLLAHSDASLLEAGPSMNGVHSIFNYGRKWDNLITLIAKYTWHHPCLTTPMPLSISSVPGALGIVDYRLSLFFILHSFLLTADLSRCVKWLPRKRRYGALYLCLTCGISGHKALGKIPWSWGSPAVPLHHVKAVAIFPSFLLKLL